MALVQAPGCGPDLRIYKPSYACEYPSRRAEAESRSRLLREIHNSYCKALERLSLRVRLGMAARFLDGGGFCLGLLDPVSNIVANTLISYGRRVRVGKPEGYELVYVPEEELRDLERRSLDGMVTFLTRFFPYLADCDAVRFLLLAGADLLVAVRILVKDLGMTRFGSSEPAVQESLEMALKCAALAAKHPYPDRFVGEWFAISRRLDEAVPLLAEVRRRSPLSSLDKLAKLLDGPQLPLHYVCEDLRGPWRLAASRLPPPRSVPYQRTTALKGTLQDAIHGFYLKALARLPAGELRSRLHRSLLEAGHCYGPLDPVSNIIVNTIWYDAAFPPSTKLELEMIGTMGLHRMENRSLYGLASFLCTRNHHIDFHQAMYYLLRADANLYLTDPNLGMENFHALGWVDQNAPATSVEEAFLAAATAACHPNPNAQVEFFTSFVWEVAVNLLRSEDQLSSERVQQLARYMCPQSVSSEKPPRPFPFTEYLCEHTRVSKKVNTALNTLALMPNGEPMYELHVICGVNNHVAGPVYCLEADTIAPYKCNRSHVNFLATRKDGAPVLFFAEFSNDEKDKGGVPFLCCRVSVPPPSAERVRCLYCDYMGTRIVHPVGEDFHGRKWEFEKMVCGQDPCNEDFDPAVMQPYYTNMNIIAHSRLTTERINGKVEDDRLYADCSGYMSDEYDSDLSSMSEDE